VRPRTAAAGPQDGDRPRSRPLHLWRRRKALATDKAAALAPTLVVAGHKKVENNNDPKIIGESQQYLRAFSRIAAEETTAAGIVAWLVERYPDWANGRTLWHSARTAIKRKDS
jgi:hypothetical protein